MPLPVAQKLDDTIGFSELLPDSAVYVLFQFAGHIYLSICGKKFLCDHFLFSVKVLNRVLLFPQPILISLTKRVCSYFKDSLKYIVVS